MATTCNCNFKHTLLLSLILILTSSFPATIAAPSSEPDILLQFKNSIEDPMNILSGWSNTTPTHHCNWTGVSCADGTHLSVSALNLQSFNLSGQIPSSVCQLRNLADLNLADNLFDQPIPLHLSQCASLVALNLSKNLIWGTLPEQLSLFKSSLQVLDLSRNRVEGRIPDTIGSLHKLKLLNLGGNLLSGSLPMVFGNFTELLVLDLSQNPFLVSEIPVGVGQLSKLEQLLLQSSGFYGEIPDFFKGLRSLKALDLSQNNLTGNLPQLDLFLPNLVYFDVSENKLSGPFPVGVCEAGGLMQLSLHSNLFSGPISNELINECTNLERFTVHNNGFSGNFPSLLWSLPRIRIIRAENNRFSGEIPDSISQAAQLEHVQIDNNSFTSVITLGLGKVRSLYRFSASMNSLYGELPPNFCDSPVMSIINLSNNFLSGKIPEVRKCRKLVLLSLANNSFEGEIPISITDLPVLTYLDLSHNNLTGSIPQEIEKLKLALFNVSFNHLSGRVSASLISGLPASFLEGNKGLCGPGLPASCLDDKKMNKTSGFAKLTCVLVLIALGFALLVFAFGFYLLRSHKRKSDQLGTWRSVFFYPLRLTESDLIIVMNEKAVRGNGSFGRVYVVNLPSGEPVVVKKMIDFVSQSPRALKNEVKTLAKIRHKNIVKILGFCSSDDSVLFIYEYLPKGSLGDLIGGPDFNLAWSVRLKIATGIAQGLAYLHKDYLPHLLHRNLKSNNVLIDADFEPKLTDFALDRIVGENAFESILTSEPAPSCYLAPEYSHTKKATEQIDTYSFGVIMLELLTGRLAEPNGTGEEGSVDVVKWVRRKINITNGALKVLDPKMSCFSQEQMRGALEIALRCTCVVPEKRPSMCEVVGALQSLYSRTSSHVSESSSATSVDISVPL